MRNIYTTLAVGVCLSACHKAWALNTYHVGNSLTADARIYDGTGLPNLADAAGLTLTTGFHIRCGQPLSYMIENPEDTCAPPNDFGYFTEGLSQYAWDAITLQPFSGGGTPRLEYEAAKTLTLLAQQNPANMDTVVYLYASWPGENWITNGFNEFWYDPTPADPDANLLRNAQGFGWIYDNLAADPGLAGTDFRMIPVGDVLAELDLRMRNGQIPGFNDAGDLYRDALHLDNLGRFLAANTFFATMFGLNPTGLPVDADFDQSPIPSTTVNITPELAATVQSLIWEVVVDHPLTGVIAGDLDHDGFVGIADLNLVLSQWNQNVSPATAADPTGDGFVGIEDLNTVLSNWNAGTPPMSNVVPEPASAAVLALGMLGVIRRRRPAF